jgi:hypothetical protein
MVTFRTSFSLGAFALLIAASLGTASPAQAVPYQGFAPANRMQPAKAKAEWLGVSSVSIKAGTTSEFIHSDCPSQFPVVVSGAFAGSTAAQDSSYTLGYDGPRIDESPPNFGEWGWHFYWPGGAPDGTSFSFSLYCSK